MGLKKGRTPPFWAYTYIVGIRPKCNGIKSVAGVIVKLIYYAKLLGKDTLSVDLA